MRGQRLAGIFVQFWAVLCAKSATNNLRVLITEIAKSPPPSPSSATKSEMRCIRADGPQRTSARPDLRIPGGSCFTHAELHAPASRQGTSRGLLREFPAASVRASP